MYIRDVKRIWYSFVIIVTATVFGGCGFVLEGDYVFDPVVLAEIAQQNSGLTGAELSDQIGAALVERYPDVIIETDANWNLNTTDGVPGRVKILYWRSEEYLVLISSPSSINWSFGPYENTEIRDYVFSGELQCYGKDDLTVTSYLPGGENGQEVVLEANTTKNYSIPQEAWMLEYGRGNFPGTFYNPDIILPGLVSEAASLTSSIASEIIGNLIREWFGLGQPISF